MLPASKHSFRYQLWALLVAIIFAAAAAQERPLLSTLLNSDSDAGFEKAIEPRTFVFPDDHGPHARFRNEWWYLTGNLDADNDNRYGYELTIFRFALTADPPQPDSNWRTNQIFIAHFAVTDVDAERFYVAERFSRGALGLAGAQLEPFRVWIDDWEISEKANDATSIDGPERWRLSAADTEMSLELTLVAVKPPILNGIDGLSQKSEAIGNASYYYSIPRLKSVGKLKIGDSEYSVTGLSWLDREWSSSSLGSEQEGWDWFALQLSDGSDLMFYNLRKTDGSQDELSAGTWIRHDGSAEHIRHDELEVIVTATWQSPAGGTYPAQWQIRLQRHDLLLTITPVIADQELFTTVRYWEGAVDVQGKQNGARINGRGYVELTGYAE